MTDTAATYCAEQLRRQDRDRYLLALTASPDLRPHLMALYAFNLEVAKTADVVSEAMLGRIRLQWWREALDELVAGQPRRHEVVDALADLHKSQPLDRAGFERIIDARETDLEAEPIASMQALENYARQTSGDLQRLAAAILGSDSTGEAVRDSGTGYALARLLRAVPFHAARNRVFLPADLLRQEGLNRDDLAMPRKPEALARVVAAVADVAQSYVDRARRARPADTARILPALLPASLADYDLSLLRARNYDVFAPAPNAEAWRRPLLITWRSWRGRY